MKIIYIPNIKIFFYIYLLYICKSDINILNSTNLISNGTFIIKLINDKSKYFKFENNKLIISDKIYEFEIYKYYLKGYIIKYKSENKLFGLDKEDKNNFHLYDKKVIIDKNFDIKLLLWNLININEYDYLIENNYNNKFIKLNESNLVFDEIIFNNFSNNNLSEKFQFKILKLYEENYNNEYFDIVEKEPIDVFIKYIDLRDKTLKRDGIQQIYKDYDNDELKYSLRSILKYIPWIRKIFIVFPNKKVSFLKPYSEINEKIVYVNDKDFLGYDSANIFAFSFNLHKMEKFGITKNFIYMEDDYFIGQPLKKTDFFYFDKQSKKIVPYVVGTKYFEIIIRDRLNLYENYFKNKNNIKLQSGPAWDFSIVSTDKFFFEKYKKKNVINVCFTHCGFPTNLDDLKEIFNDIQEYKYINETLFSKTRHVLTLNQPQFHNLYLLNIKKRKVNKILNSLIEMENLEEKMTYTPLFVINTCGNNVPTQNEYDNAKKIMEKRFPDKIFYEMDDDIATNIRNDSYIMNQTDTKPTNIPISTNNTSTNIISLYNMTNRKYNHNRYINSLCLNFNLIIIIILILLKYINKCNIINN